jgi:Ni,Fe-hydrogenase III large subunit
VRRWFRAHPGWTAAIVGVVALFVGAGIGAAGTEDQTRIEELEGQVADLKRDVATQEEFAAESRARVRAAERRADRQISTAEQRALRDAQRQLTERSQAVEQRETEVAEKEQTLEGARIPDGTWQLDRDYEAGLYRARGGEGCYWAKLSTAHGGGLDDIIENGVVGGTQTVQIDSPFFETSGCGEWQKIG